MMENVVNGGKRVIQHENHKVPVVDYTICIPNNVLLTITMNAHFNNEFNLKLVKVVLLK